VWHLVSVFLSLFTDSYLLLVGRSDDAAVRLFRKRESPLAYAIRDYLQRSDVPFDWVELKDNEQARAELGLESADNERLPICIFPDGTRMEHPTVRASMSDSGAR
jgi:hypothetical protein